jgi:hypothetical protein
LNSSGISCLSASMACGACTRKKEVTRKIEKGRRKCPYVLHTASIKIIMVWMGTSTSHTLTHTLTHSLPLHQRRIFNFGSSSALTVTARRDEDAEPLLLSCAHSALILLRMSDNVFHGKDSEGFWPLYNTGLSYAAQYHALALFCLAS